MKKIEIGQFISVLANLGVLIGILLLVYELNQNRSMMQSQIRNSIADTLVDILYQRANSPYLAGVLEKLEAGEPLSSLEAVRFDNMQAAEWRYRENVNYQYRNGLYDESEYFAQRDAWRGILNSNETIRAYWCDRNVAVSPEFMSEIDLILEQPCE